MPRYDWRKLKNDLIPGALSENDPIAALTRLYEDSGRDGVVAQALGQHLEQHGDLRRALEWFEEAESRYWDDRWKRGPREAAERVRARLMRDPEPEPGPALGPDPDPDPAPSAPGATLYVVSCTKSKAWDDASVASARYLPAAVAYTGRALATWRASAPARAGERWLILSAKYGFIEPDHPIGCYDVTFGDPSTGPVDDATLAAQVMHQARWDDATPLSSFQRVVVLGSREYLTRTRRAFARTGASVEPWQPGADAAATGEPDEDDRLGKLGAALAGLGAGVFDAADRADPELPSLRRIARLPAGVDVLLTLALALSDYQLGAGRADAYWAEVERLLDDGPPANTADILPFVRALTQRPVAARLAGSKVERIERLLASNIPAEVAGGAAGLDGPAVERLWRSLAGLYRDPAAKTVVFAVKTVGLLHLCATGRRVALPLTLPIPVDLRIARLTLASGLMAPPAGMTVSDALAAAGSVASAHRHEIVDLWSSVARSSGVSPPEMDSLLWQLADHLGGTRLDVGHARMQMATHLTGLGATGAAAQRVEEALTRAVDA